MPTTNTSPSNLDRFENDLDRLIAKGVELENAIPLKKPSEPFHRKRSLPNQRPQGSFGQLL